MLALRVMTGEQYTDLTVSIRIFVTDSPDGSWRARLMHEPSLEIDGASRDEAVLKAKALALRLLAEAIEEPVAPVSRTAARG